MDILFNPHISLWSIILLGIALIAGIIALTVGMCPQRRTGKQPPYVDPDDFESDSTSCYITPEKSEEIIAESAEMPEGAVDTTVESEEKEEGAEVVMEELEEITPLPHRLYQRPLLPRYI